MNAVEIKNLCKRYKKFAIENISFNIPTGCVVGLVGRNGSGKSTLLKMLVSAVLPDSGDLTIFGIPVNSDEFTDLKQDIGYVPDGICFPYLFDADDINKIMRVAYHIWDEALFYDYLNRFHIDRTQCYGDYSKGMIAKLSIAVAFSHNARLLIMDEATAGLDASSGEDILDIITDFTRDERNTVIISSHNMKELDRICDYIAYMKEGKLLFFEEKDMFCEKYALVRCSPEEAEKLDKKYVIGVKKSIYNAEMLMEAKAIPEELHREKARLDDVMLYIEKEEG